MQRTETILPEIADGCDSLFDSSPQGSSITGTRDVLSSLPLPDPSIINSFTSSTSDSDSSSKKKPHSGRRSQGHIPQPRDGFILFRCAFVKQKKIPETVESNHGHLSTVTGALWRRMTIEQQKPWLDLAEVEKKLHERKFPGYMYRPRSRPDQGGKGKYVEKESGKEEETPPSRPPHNHFHTFTPSDHTLPSKTACETSVGTPAPPMGGIPRRSSSCPPPSASFIPSVASSDNLPLDDANVSRRPSRITTFYQSMLSPPFTYSSPPSVPPTYPNLPTHHVMPTCPPGWVAASSDENWTEWSDDVEKELDRHLLMRNLDYDNSFKHGVPQWTNGLFQSSSSSLSGSLPVFINPFESPEVYQQKKDDHISPLERMRTPQRQKELETCRIPFEPCYSDPFYPAHHHLSGSLEPRRDGTYKHVYDLDEERFGRLSLEE